MMTHKRLPILFLGAILWTGFTVGVRADTTKNLLDKVIFLEKEQPTLFVKPSVKDGSTNIAFYIPYGKDKKWIWQAETPAVGSAPFSSYWAPTPAVGKYRVIEYKNDEQQFSCSGLSLEECVEDSHFINALGFEIVENSTHILEAAPTPITPPIIVDKSTPPVVIETANAIDAIPETTILEIASSTTIGTTTPVIRTGTSTESEAKSAHTTIKPDEATTTPN